MLLRIAALQMNSSYSVAQNTEVIKAYLAQAERQQVKLVLLPENAFQMPRNKSEQYSEEDQQGPVQQFLSEQAKLHQLWLVAGSVALKSDQKVTSSCLVYNHHGERTARYDKIHLYDVDVPEGQRYSESETYQAGAIEHNINVVDTPFLKLGLSICYDLRFPELYRKLVKQGAELLCVPAAFTAQTGKAHWQTLLQARAIENLCYVLAAGQCGTHGNGRQTWGHSMVVDPWGSVLKVQEKAQPGLVISEIDLIKLRELRKRFPALSHAKL